MAQEQELSVVEEAEHESKAHDDDNAELTRLGAEDDEKQQEERSGFDAIRAAFSTVPVPAQPLKQGWEIPVIDLSLLHGSNSRRHAVDQIAKACQEWGFFHVINHGIQEKVIDDMWLAYDVLFRVPPHERAKFDNGPFLPPDIMKILSEKLHSMPKFGESRDTIRFSKLNPDDEEAIPNTPHGFREPAIVFYRALRDVGFKLLEAISESLGMESEYIRRATGNNPCVNSSIHRYLPYHDANNTMGLNPHQDIDTLTLLIQSDIAGLQVLKEDRWVEVRPLPGSLVVNVGEVIQAFTNNKYQSVMHRAMLNKENLRSSISCFLLPTPESIIEPLPHLVSAENPPLRASCTWETYYYNHYASLLK
ncbi:hypothetical protein GOP47_0000656 [Adiantum capillus-veneris]|uniref:Fe2OG dioxygenase domain-containing protein n=1 Tax=Adiantum capillus-veneris TaxID=13818 RepID=A0A9D4ZT43_ADICA|nr:hypothetical protein GOP47_0000656 [Adiantum capillus-veneris]